MGRGSFTVSAAYNNCSSSSTPPPTLVATTSHPPEARRRVRTDHSAAAAPGRLYGKLSSWDAYAPVSTAALVLTLWDDIDSAAPQRLHGARRLPLAPARLLRRPGQGGLAHALGALDDELAAPHPCHILEAHLTSNNAALKAAIVEAAVASVQAKEVLLLGVVCPPVQSEFLSIVASLVPFSFGLKERSTRWVSSLRMKPETTEPLVNTMGHIMSATLRRKAATLELAALVEGGEREKATTRLLELIEDLDYEVRALAIKFALKALQSDTSLLFDWQRVQGTLLQRLHTESHHTCIKHLLALLFVFPVPLPDSVLLGDAAVGSALDTQTFFAHLRGLLDRWPNGATRENIVSHMGVYLSQGPACFDAAAVAGMVGLYKKQPVPLAAHFATDEAEAGLADRHDRLIELEDREGVRAIQTYTKEVRLAFQILNLEKRILQAMKTSRPDGSMLYEALCVDREAGYDASSWLGAGQRFQDEVHFP
ncbi:uncharacterized protein ACA1_293050 [Acanthamoeba castellanii str. Neff]|uniref:Uncharacterized protein n=1 Tax=Acanthamoeba castellanii (strain ATCC 30010 / Neff) TaxID=1257118 RepID=L8HII0_ACACF|nr:uncharacterized protein ACA1_293050 [Acanthamoeba castellanii str. Neff]ELR25404.1 hypothetical protein ACA1_293050 [Acanthamoeba castellanii str. Neff]